MTLALSRFAVSVAAACLIAAPPAPAGAQEPGEALYAKRCAMCHDKDVPRAPRRDTLRLMSPEAILGALQGGTMAPQAVGLTLAEKRAVAVYAAGKDFGTGGAATGRCSAGAPAFTLDGPEWAGWGAGPENARFQPKPGLTPADLEPVEGALGLRLPGIDSRLRRPCRRRRARVRRQRRWRALRAGRAHRMHPLEPHRGSVGARGAERRPVEGWTHGGVLRRPERAALRARRGARHAALADGGRRSDRGGDHRRTQAARRTALRSDLGGRGRADARSQVSLLPGARRARRGRCGNGKDPLESPLRRRSADRSSGRAPPAPIVGVPRARASGTPPPSTR